MKNKEIKYKNKLHKQLQFDSENITHNIKEFTIYKNKMNKIIQV